MSAARLHEWVTKAAEVRPEAGALRHPDATMTYLTLERASNRVARLLREAGCRRGDRVAFLLPRSPMTIAVMVGILKADCIYVPLDLRSPGARLAGVVEKCQPKMVIAGPATEEETRDLARAGGLDRRRLLGWMGREPPAFPLAPEHQERTVDSPAFTLDDVESLPAERPDSRATPGDAVYILFTSGSTGTPKGVVITHRNVATFIEWAIRHFELGPLDRLGGYTELTFDLSTFDIYATFAAGAELHLIPDELKLLPPKVVEHMRAADLTHWLSVPSFLDYVARFDSLRPHDLPSMKWVTWCGDVLPTPALHYWMERLSNASFANLFGPTETTVASTCFDVRRPLADKTTPVPIGRPCDGEEVLVLDDELKPVGPGEVGHIHIRGAGVSPGYWRDPERTREVFLPDPFGNVPGARLYRTGDLGRFDAEGNLRFLGREDDQVKTRGFRVELGEVETTLRALPEIEECAVVGFTRNGAAGKLLACAYVPAQGRGSVRTHVKSRVRELLPDYMIPVRWKAVERIPLNDRGKVDRRTIQAWMEEES